MLTRPAKDMKMFFFLPCRELAKPKEPEDSQLIQRIVPNSTVGPILSVRTFEFESLHVLNILGHRLLGHAVILQAERFHGYDKGRRNN